MAGIKAYKCYDRNAFFGSVVVFAPTRNKAKILALSSDYFEEVTYIDMEAKRFPGLDGYRDYPCVGDLDDMELRKILVQEYSWRCLEPLYEDCESCRLCEEWKVVE